MALVLHISFVLVASWPHGARHLGFLLLTEACNMAAYMVFFTNISYVVQLDVDFCHFSMFFDVSPRSSWVVFRGETYHIWVSKKWRIGAWHARPYAPPRHSFHGSTMLCSGILLTYCAANTLGLLLMERLKGSVLVKAKITAPWREHSLEGTAPRPHHEYMMVE